MSLAALLLLVAAQGPGERTYNGPALMCGEAFALRIEAGERAVARDSGMDFLTYSVEGPGGNFVLYEGNAPRPHDDAIRTGRSWPSVIAIHDRRNARAKAQRRLRARLVTGPRRSALCPPRVPPPPRR